MRKVLLTLAFGAALLLQGMIVAPATAQECTPENCPPPPTCEVGCTPPPCGIGCEPAPETPKEQRQRERQERQEQRRAEREQRQYERCLDKQARGKPVVCTAP